MSLQKQQGDVWIESINAIPADATPMQTAVLAEGEGHHLHRFAVPANVQLFQKNGITYARVFADTKIEHVTPDGRHGEHNPISIPPGEYEFGQISEYDYTAQMARKVID